MLITQGTLLYSGYTVVGKGHALSPGLHATAPVRGQTKAQQACSQVQEAAGKRKGAEEGEGWGERARGTGLRKPGEKTDGRPAAGAQPALACALRTGPSHTRYYKSNSHFGKCEKY